MNDFSAIVNLPEVISSVVSDLSGTLFDSAGDIDGEGIAAVMGFAANQMQEAGESLGLGSLHRISIQGDASACVITVDGERVITAYLDPRKPIANFEKKLDSILHR